MKLKKSVHQPKKSYICVCDHIFFPLLCCKKNCTIHDFPHLGRFLTNRDFHSHQAYFCPHQIHFNPLIGRFKGANDSKKFRFYLLLIDVLGLPPPHTRAQNLRAGFRSDDEHKPQRNNRGSLRRAFFSTWGWCILAQTRPPLQPPAASGPTSLVVECWLKTIRVAATSCLLPCDKKVHLLPQWPMSLVLRPHWFSRGSRSSQTRLCLRVWVTVVSSIVLSS